MKAFNQQLTELNSGSAHSAATAALDELLRAVQDTGRAGSLTIKLKVAPASGNSQMHVDKITITPDMKLELPKPSQPADFFYLTEDGETSRNHPKQQKLPLHSEDTSAPPAISTTDADGVITFKKVD